MKTMRSLAAVILCLLPFTLGCGPSSARTQLQGKVTYRNKPVGEQTLTLYSQGAREQFFTHKIPIFADGAFSGQGPVPGTYKVVIEESMAAQEGRKSTGEKTVVVPTKYRREETTDLTWIIKPGENKRDIELTD